MTSPGLAVNLAEVVRGWASRRPGQVGAESEAEQGSVQLRSVSEALARASRGEVRLLAGSSGSTWVSDALSTLQWAYPFESSSYHKEADRRRPAARRKNG